MTTPITLSMQIVDLNKENELRQAAYEGDLGKVTQLVAQGTKVNASFSSTGHNPLLSALDNVHLGPQQKEVALYLVKNGAKINMASATGHTPFMASTRRTNDIEFLEELINQGAEINSQDNIGFTPFMWAVFNERLFTENDFKKIQFLLSRGAKVNTVSNAGSTALNLLLGRNAQANRTNPIYYDTVTLLLKFDANPNIGKIYYHLFIGSNWIYVSQVLHDTVLENLLKNFGMSN